MLMMIRALKTMLTMTIVHGEDDDSHFDVFFFSDYFLTLVATVCS
jgi:hypothetical protein